jgi:hypothetical protein
VHEIHDLRRWVAFRSQGAVRLFLGVNDQLEDVRGALTASQWEVAALAARQVLLVCLSVRGLETSGEPFACADDLAFDPFAGTDLREVEEAMSLADEILDIGAGDWPDWYNRLCGFVAQTGHRLGYDNPMRSLADVRRPHLDLARQWLAPTEELRLPLPLR